MNRAVAAFVLAGCGCAAQPQFVRSCSYISLSRFENTGTVPGRTGAVVDVTWGGDPRPGAFVTDEANDEANAYAQTDERGEAFVALAPGPHTLTVRYLEESLEIPVDVTDGATRFAVTLDGEWELLELGVPHAGTVDVTSTAQGLSADDAKELRRIPWSPTRRR